MVTMRRGGGRHWDVVFTPGYTTSVNGELAYSQLEALGRRVSGAFPPAWLRKIEAIESRGAKQTLVILEGERRLAN